MQFCNIRDLRNADSSSSKKKKRLPGQHPADDGGPYVIFNLIDSQVEKKRDASVSDAQRS